MLNKNIFRTYLTGLLNLVLIAVISTCLTFLLLHDQVVLHGVGRILYQFVFFITLDYLIYAVIFSIMFYRNNVGLLEKAITIGILSIAVFIFFSYAASSIIPLKNSTYLIKLFIFFCAGFLLPYTHYMIRRFFI